MPPTSMLLAAATLPLLALSTPTSNQAGFTVPRVPTGYTNKHAAAYSRTLRKYNVQQDISGAFTANNTGSVEASPVQYDAEYLSPVNIGSNQLNLDFDTGSSDLWVFSTLFPSAQNASAHIHSFYDPSISGSLQPNRTWEILYGDGTGASGTVYSDEVVIGGATVTSQAVEAATSVASQFLSQPGDGFLGLGFEGGNTCSPEQCGTFFSNLMRTTPEQVFTADLQPSGGSYDFGFIDQDRYSGEIGYVDVLHESPAYWDFTAGSYSINGMEGGQAIGYSIMDTGTSIWYLPETPTKEFYKSFNSSFDEDQGAYVYPCSITPPEFTVEIGGMEFVVPGEAINFGPVEDGSENCIGGIQYSSVLPGSIFGDVFMKNFFVVFDQGRERIGVARQQK